MSDTAARSARTSSFSSFGRRSQHTSNKLTLHLALEGIVPLIGIVGDAYDTALSEIINGLYKAACVRTTVFHEGPTETAPDVKFATAGCVNWYNSRRLHGSLGTISPNDYEATCTRESIPE